MEVHAMGAVKTHKNKPRKPQPVTVIKVWPVVWSTALDLAGGNGKRLEIVNESTVIVRNHAWQVNHGA